MSDMHTIDRSFSPIVSGADSPSGGNLVANSFEADKIEYFRSLFEHLYRQPPAQRPLPPGINNLVRLGAALGGLLSTSGGEHMLLTLTGQIDPSVTARDLQFASVALDHAAVSVDHWRERWNRDQKSAFIRAAAVVGEDLSNGRIDARTAREAILLLIDEADRLSTGSAQPDRPALA